MPYRELCTPASSYRMSPIRLLLLRIWYLVTWLFRKPRPCLWMCEGYFGCAFFEDGHGTSERLDREDVVPALTALARRIEDAIWSGADLVLANSPGKVVAHRNLFGLRADLKCIFEQLAEEAKGMGHSRLWYFGTAGVRRFVSPPPPPPKPQPTGDAQ